MPVRDPIAELDDLRAKRTEAFVAGILRIAREVRGQPFQQVSRVVAATRSLGEVISEAKQWSNILGRRRTMLQVAARKRAAGLDVGMSFAAKAETLAKVEFTEATEDILSRLPVSIEGQEQAFKAVQELYSREHGFALARSAEATVTTKIQNLLAEALRTGQSLPKGQALIQELFGWSRAYAETIFRTNLNSAYNAGALQQALSPELDDFIVGLRRVPVGDRDTRDNHNFTLIAAKRDPIWLELGVPAGYNCRCAWELIDSIEAERSGITIPLRAQHPGPGVFFNDPGFENRLGFEVFGVSA